LSNNRIDKNDVSFSTNGIKLYADPDATVSHTLIEGNTVYHNYENGIVLEAGADSNVLSANYVVTNPIDGILVIGDDNKIIQNTSLGNGIWDLADAGTGNIWLLNDYETASWE